KRQADAVLRRADQGRTALLRPAAKPAERLHGHQLRVLADRWTAQALRTGCNARTRRRSGAVTGGPERVLLRLRAEGHGRRRRPGAARHRPASRARLGHSGRSYEEAGAPAPGDLLNAKLN